MPSVLGYIPPGSRYGNVPNELVHRAGLPFLDNYYCNVGLAKSLSTCFVVKHGTCSSSQKCRFTMHEHDTSFKSH